MIWFLWCLLSIVSKIMAHIFDRSLLYLVHLLLSKEVKRLKITLCCYYGCRDKEGVLRCIKKNGSSLEFLELTRSSLLRMDPLLFR